MRLLVLVLVAVLFQGCRVSKRYKGRYTGIAELEANNRDKVTLLFKKMIGHPELQLILDMILQSRDKTTQDDVVKAENERQKKAQRSWYNPLRWVGKKQKLKSYKSAKELIRDKIDEFNASEGDVLEPHQVEDLKALASFKRKKEAGKFASSFARLFIDGEKRVTEAVCRKDFGVISDDIKKELKCHNAVKHK